METILLIENNAQILDNLTEYFEMEGFNVLGASNGEKGIEQAKAFIPSLIICDTFMPQKAGFEILSLLLKTESTSSIPFIFTTTMFEKNNRSIILQQGADDYIIKPFELKSLLILAKAWIKTGSRRCRNPSLINE